MAKNCQKHLIWRQNYLKVGDQIFFRGWCLNKMCRECSNLLKYEISAKTNEAFSRKWRKTAKKPYFGHKMLNNLDTFFFSNRASSLFYIWYRLTCCKKSEKTNGGKYDNFCDRQTDGLTDRQTDGGKFKGPKCWSKKI